MLSGSCFAAVGVVAGLGEAAPGVVWLDSHADFNEPATTISGYIDGMGLAILTGSAWQAMLATVPGATPVPESAVVLAGARALDPPEEVRLRASRIARLTAAELESAGRAPRRRRRPGAADLRPLRAHRPRRARRRRRPRERLQLSPTAPAPTSSTRSWPRSCAPYPVRAVSLTAYDPAFDGDDRVPPIALRLLRTLAAAI